MTPKMLLLTVLLSIVSCNKKGNNSPISATPSGSGALSTAELVGRWSVCRIVSDAGNDFPNPSSHYDILTIEADESYNFSQMYFTGTSTCQGGDHVVTYTQWGTLSQEGSATSPAGSTKFEFTSDETLITFYDEVIKNHFMASCPTLSMNHTSTSSRNPSTPPCNVGSDILFDGFTGAVNTTYNVLSLNRTTTPYTLSAGGHFDWQPGMGGYPSTLSLNYRKE